MLCKSLLRKSFSLFDILLFLFFVTLHADQLNCILFNYTIRINNLFGLLLCLFLAIQNRFKLLHINRSLLLSLLFLFFSALLSAIYSPYQERCVIFGGWFVFTLLLYFLFPYFLMTMGKTERIFKIYLLSFICVGLYALMQFLFSIFHLRDPFAQQSFLGENWLRPNALAYEPSYYALYMTPFVMLINFHYLFCRTTSFFQFEKLKLSHVLFINLLFLISTSTSAFISYFIFFLCLLLIQIRKMKIILKYLAWFCLGSGMGCLIFPQIFLQFYFKFFRADFVFHHSFYERWFGIQNAWKIFLSRPFFGIGLGAIPSYLYEAWINEEGGFVFSPSMALVIETALSPLKAFEPTNVLTEILASLGLVGFCAFAYFLSNWIKLAKATLQHPLALNLLLSIAIQLIVLQFNQGVLRTYVWVHLGLTLGLLEKMSHETNQLCPLAPR